ncbi:MAG: hypothetical protein ACOX3L_02230 [Lutisporaceae bacterium]
MILIVSHDRELLDKLCSKIVEIEGGELKQYSGKLLSVQAAEGDGA